MNRYCISFWIISFWLTSFVTNDIYAQLPDHNEGNVISWSANYKLKWSDFEANEKPNKGFGVATTTSDFIYKYNQDETPPYISISVVFYCDRSWRNRRFEYPDILRHEQLHFDICELYGRKLNQGIHNLIQENKISKVSVDNLYQQLQSECNKVQDQYDDETNGSTNAKMQKVWQNKIDQALKQLADYADYHYIPAS